MTPLLSLILPALLPAVADGFKGIFQKLFGGTKPINVDEQIKLMQAETDRLRAIAEIDKPSDNISRWVADLRASFRYIAAGLIVLSAIGCLFVETVKPEFAEMMLQLAGSVFSFMFGDRVYLSLRGKK